MEKKGNKINTTILVDFGQAIEDPPLSIKDEMQAMVADKLLKEEGIDSP